MEISLKLYTVCDTWNKKRLQNSAEKTVKQLENQLVDISTKYEQSQRELNEIRSQKGQVQAELQEKSRQLEESENQVRWLPHTCLKFIANNC